MAGGSDAAGGRPPGSNRDVAGGSNFLTARARMCLQGEHLHTLSVRRRVRVDTERLYLCICMSSACVQYGSVKLQVRAAL